MTGNAANEGSIYIQIILYSLWVLSIQTWLSPFLIYNLVWAKEESLVASNFLNIAQDKPVFSKSMTLWKTKIGFTEADKWNDDLTEVYGWNGKSCKCYLEVMNSMRVLTFPSCSTEMSTSLRIVVCRWEMAALLFPKLILEEVELELSPESVMGEGW